MLYDTVGHAWLVRRSQVLRGSRLYATGRVRFR